MDGCAASVAWQVSRLGSRQAQGGEAKGRHNRRRRRTGPGAKVRRTGLVEALTLILACGAFISLFAYAFSRPARSDGSPAVEQAQSVQNDVMRAASQGIAQTKDRAKYDAPRNTRAGENMFDCETPAVTDGDTLRCGPLRVRLASIDAPELPGHCRAGRVCTSGDPWASSKHLQTVIAGKPLVCRRIDIDHYGRTVAFCSAEGRDLSCAQVTSGNAVVRYGRLSCK